MKEENWKTLLAYPLADKRVGFGESQFHTALHAFHMLYGGPPYATDAVEKLKSIADAEGYYPPQGIVDLYEHLGMYRANFRMFPDLRVGSTLPIECGIWTRRYGFRSICIVDFEIKTDACRVTNLDRHTTMEGWIFLEELHTLIREWAEGLPGKPDMNPSARCCDIAMVHGPIE